MVAATIYDQPRAKTRDRIPNAPKYRVWGRDEVVYGPFDLLTLVSWVRRRRVQRDSWIYSESRRGWTEAGQIEELRTLFEELPRTRAVQVVGAVAAGVSPELLSRVKLLSGLTNQQLVSFLEYMEVDSLEPMAYAVREGQPGDSMFIILEGELRVQLTRDGRESVLATLTAGDVFGEISLLDQGPRSADVIANDRSTLLKISAASFALLRREAPALTEPVLHALGKSVTARLRMATQRYQESRLMLQTLTADEI